jgi:type IV secretory pathway protease TraF
MSSRFLTLLTMICAASVVIITIGPKPAPSLVWNASESVPIGLYRVQPAGKLTVTDLVVAMPPEPLATFLAEGGYLPRGLPLIKRVLALPGQTVCRRGLPSWSTESRWRWHASATAVVGRSPYGSTVASSLMVKCSS